MLVRWRNATVEILPSGCGQPGEEEFIIEEELKSRRKANSEQLVSRVRAHEKDEEVFKKTKEEVPNGWVKEPRELTEKDVEESTLSRRIPVG